MAKLADVLKRPKATQQRGQRAAGAAAGASDERTDAAGRRRMPANMLNAFDPGWRPPRPWFIPLGDPVRAEQLKQERQEK